MIETRSVVCFVAAVVDVEGVLCGTPRDLTATFISRSVIDNAADSGVS